MSKSGFRPHTNATFTEMRGHVRHIDNFKLFRPLLGGWLETVGAGRRASDILNSVEFFVAITLASSRIHKVNYAFRQDRWGVFVCVYPKPELPLSELMSCQDQVSFHKELIQLFDWAPLGPNGCLQARIHSKTLYQLKQEKIAANQ